MGRCERRHAVARPPVTILPRSCQKGDGWRQFRHHPSRRHHSCSNAPGQKRTGRCVRVGRLWVMSGSGGHVLTAHRGSPRPGGPPCQGISARSDRSPNRENPRRMIRWRGIGSVGSEQGEPAAGGWPRLAGSTRRGASRADQQVVGRRNAPAWRAASGCRRPGCDLSVARRRTHAAARRTPPPAHRPALPPDG